MVYGGNVLGIILYRDLYFIATGSQAEVYGPGVVSTAKHVAYKRRLLIQTCILEV